MRVDEAAHIVGWVYMIVSIVVLNPLGFVAALDLVFAKEKEKPGLYLPFLMFHVSRLWWIGIV